MSETQHQAMPSEPKGAQDASDAIRTRIEAALEARDWDEAGVLLQSTLSQDPSWAQGYAHLGICLVQQGRLNEAKVCLLQAVALDPNDLDAYYNLGCIFQQTGEEEKALSCYKEVVTVRQDDHETFTRMGECAEKLGRAEDAILFYTQATSLRPGVLGPAVALGRLHLRRNDLMHAQGVIGEALRYHPEESALNLSLGLILETQGRCRDALPHFRAVVLADDQNEEAFFHLGSCARAVGLSPQAEAFLAKAIKLKPGYLEPIYELGQLYQERGELDRAVAAFHECLRQIEEVEERQQAWDQEVDMAQRVLVLNALGLCHRQRADHLEAQAVWRESLALDPGQEDVQAWLDEMSPSYRRTSLTID